MDQFVQGNALMIMTSMLYCLSFFLSHGKAQTTVDFAVNKTEVVVGEAVTFQCTSEGFDTTRDLLDIQFNREQIIQYVNGAPLYFNGRSEMNYTIHEFSGPNNKHGISLTVNKVNVNEDGIYTCTIKKHGMNMIFTSESITLVVKYFPSPGCFVGNTGDEISLSGDQLIISRAGVNVSLICSSRTADDNVYVGWVASDFRETPTRTAVMQRFTFISSQSDNGVHFTCTSTSSSIANVIYQCKIIVSISDDIKTTIAVPKRVTTTETMEKVATTTVPTTTTPLKTFLKTFSTPLKTTSKMSTPVSSTKVITGTTKVKTEASKPTAKLSITTATLNSPTMTTASSSELPLALIVGASGVAALLVLICIVILACICVTRPRKRRRKRHNNADNVHLVTQRPNRDINNRDNEFVSDIALSTNNKRPLSRLAYQNGNIGLHNAGEESMSHSISSTTRFPPGVTYVNSEEARNNLMDSHSIRNGSVRDSEARNNIMDSHSIRNGSVRDSVANTGTLNSEYSQSSRARHYSNQDNLSQVSYPSVSEPPIYADVNKKNKKKVISELSGTSSLPKYAVVNKNRNRSNKRQNRNPPGVAPKHQPTRSMHYDDVEFPRPSSVKGRQLSAIMR